MSVEPLASLDRSTLRERALEALRAAITSGQYRPGDHLGEVELGKHLGVSRGTVREALRHLQQEGLVTAGNRGMLRVNSVLVDAWRYLEGRIRVTIMNYESDRKPTMMSRDRHTPIVDAIESGDVPAAVDVIEQHMAAAAAQYAPISNGG